MKKEGWSWQGYVNDVFPGLIFISVLVIIMMIVGAYLIL
jgi:hypothetical protein